MILCSSLSSLMMRGGSPKIWASSLTLYALHITKLVITGCEMRHHEHLGQLWLELGSHVITHCNFCNTFLSFTVIYFQDSRISRADMITITTKMLNSSGSCGLFLQGKVIQTTRTTSWINRQWESLTGIEAPSTTRTLPLCVHTLNNSSAMMIIFTNGMEWNETTSLCIN